MNINLPLHWKKSFSFVILASLVTTLGCSSSNETFERAEVSGTVTLDGKPLAKGMIYFIPEKQGEDGKKSSVSIENGKFEADRYTGPPVGNHLVKIYSTDNGGFALDDETAIERLKEQGKRKIEVVTVPKQYNERSTLTADVTQEGPNNLKFELSSKPKRR